MLKALSDAIACGIFQSWIDLDRVEARLPRAAWRKAPNGFTMGERRVTRNTAAGCIGNGQKVFVERIYAGAKMNRDRIVCIGSWCSDLPMGRVRRDIDRSSHTPADDGMTAKQQYDVRAGN
ncbi:hypothetical protein BSZ21_20895 [Bradyrhizobium canariense]|nr:hypothetical protein BST65_32595 [Bradyrhizobium canariense]OSI33427.1 hypothetical protein BST66_13565 [Bradyrhizobium canariense]OSI39647.1 hypothetical protein BSZ20_29430 [Bradyrhizobium canariense]OSI47670.1 hypothetical protein BST67_19910 [Bradyrhizobium canariense]OSI56014.1 hypothetical protein BSZ15_18410 [Bradyrhizobium canariense]